MKIPRILKHMTVAIFYGGTVGRQTRDAFQKAFTIAQSQLIANDYIVGSGEDFTLTDKGIKRERKYHNEGIKGWVKDRQFDWYYLWLKHKSQEARTQDMVAQDLTSQAEPDAKSSDASAANEQHSEAPLMGSPVQGSSPEELDAASTYQRSTKPQKKT